MGYAILPKITIKFVVYKLNLELIRENQIKKSRNRGL